MFSVARGDDLHPPDWRGDDGTTYQRWGFGTAVTNPAPDDVDNDNTLTGTTSPGPDILVTPAFGKQHYNMWGNRQGVWPLSGTIGVAIPNTNIENEYKLVQIQLTWAGEVGTPDAEPAVNISAISVGGQEVPYDSISLEWKIDDELETCPTGVPGAGEYWHHTTYLYKIVPNPKEETICINSTIMVDELIIDTICTPEPTTLGLLVVGGVSLLLRRRWSFK